MGKDAQPALASSFTFDREAPFVKVTVFFAKKEIGILNNCSN